MSTSNPPPLLNLETTLLCPYSALPLLHARMTNGESVNLLGLGKMSSMNRAPSCECFDHKSVE